MSIKHFLFWLPMILIAFGNATLRELVLIKHFSEFRSHQLSTVTLMLLCTIYVWFVFPYLNIQNQKKSLLIGFAWVLLTMAFEFSLGRLTNKSWEYLFRDYNLFSGRLWLVFLVCLFMLPYLFYMLRGKQP